MNDTLSVVVIGLGHQSCSDHLPAIKESSRYKLIAVCDKEPEKLKSISQQYNVPGFSSIDELLKKCLPDVAIVAVPHNAYYEIIEKLAEHHIHIIKEKPFATTMEEALKLHYLIEKTGIFLGITLQRRFNPIFQTFLQLKSKIGKIYSIEGRYTMNIEHLDEGWRAAKKYAGGGALIDMGYHYIDLLVWYMGVPQTVSVKMSTGNRLRQKYDVEDTVNLLFDYHIPNESEKIIGNFIISRVYPHKEECLKIYGTGGVIELRRDEIKRLDQNGNEIECLIGKGSRLSVAIEQLDYFYQQIKLDKRATYTYKEHFKHVAIIEAAYLSNKNRTMIQIGDIMKKNNGGIL